MMNTGKRPIKMLRRCWLRRFKIHSDILKLSFPKYLVTRDLTGEHAECKFPYTRPELEVKKKTMRCLFGLFYSILVFYALDLT